MHTNIHKHSHTNTNIYTHTYVHTHIHPHTYTHNIYTYIYTHIYTHMHTHTYNFDNVANCNLIRHRKVYYTDESCDTSTSLAYWQQSFFRELGVQTFRKLKCTSSIEKSTLRDTK